LINCRREPRSFFTRFHLNIAEALTAAMPVQTSDLNSFDRYLLSRAEIEFLREQVNLSFEIKIKHVKYLA
jgi:hypothetical protein